MFRRARLIVLIAGAGAVLTIASWTPAPLAGSKVEAASQAAAAPAGLAPYTETIPNTKVTFDMVPIPAGSFTMGSPESEPGRVPDEGPQVQVRLPAFYMGRIEVTWNEFDEFAFSLDLQRKRRLGLDAPKDAADAITRPSPPYADESWGWGKEKQPVVGITQHAATQYCEWLSARTGKKYRLPTEAEWEYAARAGSQTAFHFGDDPAQLPEYAWFRANSEDQPQIGAQKKPNAWGLYDMHGNVAEWTSDAYAKDYYAELAPGPVTAPTNAPDADSLYGRVVRGGSWDDDAVKLRSAARLTSIEAWSRRDPQNPQSRWWHTDATFVGFRIVREADGAAR
jgi:formylglycine-generating enzyme required for sulfatase activity